MPPFFLGLILMSASPASAGDCAAQYQPNYENEWEIGRARWEALCAMGTDSADVLRLVQAKFMQTCSERLAHGVAQGKATLHDIQSACLRGKTVAERFKAERGIAAEVSFGSAGVPPPSYVGEKPSLREPFDHYLTLIEKYADPHDYGWAREGLSLQPKLELIPVAPEYPHNGTMHPPPKGWSVVLYLRPGVEAPSDVELAGVFLHELHHAARFARGGGWNYFTRERDAFDVKYRFLTRYQQHTQDSPRDKISRKTRENLERWQKFPKTAQADMSECYWGEESSDRTISAQKAATKEPHVLKGLEIDERESQAALAYHAAWRRGVESDFLESIPAIVAEAAALGRYSDAELKKYEGMLREDPWLLLPSRQKR